MSFSSLPAGSISGVDPLVGTAEHPTLRPHVPPLTVMTPPSPIAYAAESKYYICSIPNASFHRFDGTRVGFRFGFLETNLIPTIEYLEGEIINGNTYLRRANPDEIIQAKMRLDPVGTIREQVREEIEAELRVKLEAEIRQKLGMLQELNTPAEQKEVERSNSDGTKLDQVSLRAKLAMQKETIKTDGAKVTMDAPAPPLRGVVSTTDIAGAAKG